MSAEVDRLLAEVERVDWDRVPRDRLAHLAREAVRALREESLMRARVVKLLGALLHRVVGESTVSVYSVDFACTEGLGIVWEYEERAGIPGAKRVLVRLTTPDEAAAANLDQRLTAMALGEPKGVG